MIKPGVCERSNLMRLTIISFIRHLCLNRLAPQCSIDPSVIFTECGQVSHRHTHHHLFSVFIVHRRKRTKGEKPHQCDLCPKAFSTSSSLNTHRRIHSGEKPHQCDICDKRFTASSNLYYHKLTHSKEKPHKCVQCSKSFATPGDLRCHSHVHNGTWPFRCSICSRGFSKQTNLKNHLLIHSGQKPFQCQHCEKKFSLSCNLRSHLRTHHQELPLDFSSSSFCSSFTSENPSLSIAEDEDMIDIENEH